MGGRKIKKKVYKLEGKIKISIFFTYKNVRLFQKQKYKTPVHPLNTLYVDYRSIQTLKKKVCTLFSDNINSFEYTYSYTVYQFFI